jgi:membrane dipeptidase
MADTLRWFDENPAQGGGMLLVVSHGTFGYRELVEDSSPDSRNLRAIRSRGGVIGLTPGLPGCETADELKQLVAAIAAIPFDGRPGYEGIAIGGDLLGPEQTAPGLASARDITRSLGRILEPDAAAAIAHGNARNLLVQSAGVE